MNLLQQIFGKIMSLRHKDQEPKKVWDMKNHTIRGNNIDWLDFNKRTIMGHITPRPNKGDELRCKMSDGKTMRFEIVEVKHCKNSNDMFFATVSDIGYLER